MTENISRYLQYGLAAIAMGVTLSACSSMIDRATETTAHPNYSSARAKNIDESLRSRRSEFFSCHDRAKAKSKTNLRGKIIAAFVIGKEGKVTQSSVKSDEMQNADLEACILAVISQTQFDKPQDGVPLNVTYPFNFEK